MYARKPPRYTRRQAPHEATHRDLRHRQRPHRPGLRPDPRRGRLRRQHPREPHDRARQRVRHAAAGGRQLAHPRQARERAAEAGRSIGAHDRQRGAPSSAPSRPDFVSYTVDVVCLDQPGIAASALPGSSPPAASTSARSRRAPTPPRTPARRCSRSTWCVHVPTRIHIAALREEFMDLCDKLNLDAILEPVKA